MKIYYITNSTDNYNHLQSCDLSLCLDSITELQDDDSQYDLYYYSDSGVVDICNNRDNFNRSEILNKYKDVKK